MPILLNDIWRRDDLIEHKVHFARYNQIDQPLDVWVRDKREWQGWQEYRPTKDEFNRPYIFALMDFYHEPDTWLFGGVFRVKARGSRKYTVELTNSGSQFIGRLKVRYRHKGRVTRAKLERHYVDFQVKEILPEPYTGRHFPGYEEIDLSFGELETLIADGKPDWKGALENIKGVYMLTDGKTGKQYVGAAYGKEGIWSRWQQYIKTSHGGNAGIRKFLDGKPKDYCRTHFRFALLEHRSFNTPDATIQSREAYWKRVLVTQWPRGLNMN